MTRRPSSAARQPADAPTAHVSDQMATKATSHPVGGSLTDRPADPHLAPAPGGAGRNRQRRKRRPAAGAPGRPDPTATNRPDIGSDAGVSADSLTPVQRIMHARLHAMAQPRDGDNPRLSRLREVLRDQQIMSRVVANVDSWPELTEQQWAEAIALLRPRRNW